MVRTQEVINEIRSILHDNLTDPNSNRRQNQAPWVFTHQPNTSQLPTIQITQVDTNYESLSLGSTTQLERSRIQITIRLRPNNEYDFNTDDELETASDGIDYLISEIVSIVLDNQSTIRSNVGDNLLSLMPDLESEIIDVQGQDAIQKSIDFVAMIQK